MNANDVNSGRSFAGEKGKFAIYLVFLLLFPGFFIYHTLLGLGIIRAFLGGYFSPIALLVTLPLIGISSLAIKRRRNFFVKLDLCFLLLIAYYALVLIANFAGGANVAIVKRYLFSLIFCVDVYIIFRMVDFSNRLFITMAAASLFAMSAITIYFSIDGFFYLRSLDEASNPESLATYQGFARSFIYTFLIVISVVKSTGARFLLYGLAASSLFLNGARSEFSAVLFVVPIIEFYYAKNKMYSVNLVFFLLVWLGANADSIVGMLPDNRILQLFDLSHSSSGVAREQLSKDAWRTITENPVFGDFGSYADGHYAHNILCAWVDFGMIGFLFLATLLAWSASQLFADGYFAKAKSPDFIVACCFVCISILWALTAKAVPDMSVGAALGAYAKYRYVRKSEACLQFGKALAPRTFGAV